MRVYLPYKHGHATIKTQTCQLRSHYSTMKNARICTAGLLRVLNANACCDMIYAKEVHPMRARRLLFPCASVVFLLAIPCVAFVFWTSQASTVELPWMRWAFLASAAMLLLMLRPTMGVVVIDERGVRVRTLFKSAFIPWQDVRQVGSTMASLPSRSIPRRTSSFPAFVSRGQRIGVCQGSTAVSGGARTGDTPGTCSTSEVRPRWKRPSAIIGPESCLLYTSRCV